jgi:hypothetical protein
MANAPRASIRKGDMAMYPIKQSSGRTKGLTMFGLLLLLLLNAPTSFTLIETAEAAAACPSGLVWRERVAGDYFCVPPEQRYKLENGYCRSGYVWRESFDGDTVCVPPAERYRLANGYCRNGYVWREANPSDHVCVTPAVRAQQKTGKPAQLPPCAGLPINPITNAPIIPCQ